MLQQTQAQRLRAIRAGENAVEARRLELEEAEAAVVDLRRSAQLKLPIRETRVVTPASSHQSTPAAREKHAPSQHYVRQSETPSGGAIDLLAARKRVDQSERTDSHKRCHSTSSDASSHSRFKGMKPKEPGEYVATTIRQHQDWVRDCENVFDIMRREYRKDRKKVAYAQQFVHGDKRETWERKQKGRAVTWEYFCETLKDLIENPELRGYHQAVRFLSASQKDQTSSAFAAHLDQIEADLPLMTEDLRCLFFLCKLRPGLQKDIIQHDRMPSTREGLISLAMRLEESYRLRGAIIPPAQTRTAAPVENKHPRDSGTKDGHSVRNSSMRNNFRGARTEHDRGARTAHGRPPSNPNRIPVAPNPRTSPVPKTNKDADLAHIRCYRCDRVGHYASSCTAKINNAVNARPKNKRATQ
jgi:hypothetical protein